MNSADDMMAAADVRLDGLSADDTGTHTVTLIGVDDGDNVREFTFSYLLRADEEVIERRRNVAGANAKALAAKAGHKPKPPPSADASGGAGGRPQTAGRRR